MREEKSSQRKNTSFLRRNVTIPVRTFIKKHGYCSHLKRGKRLGEHFEIRQEAHRVDDASIRAMFRAEEKIVAQHDVIAWEWSRGKRKQPRHPSMKEGGLFSTSVEALQGDEVGDGVCQKGNWCYVASAIKVRRFRSLPSKRGLRDKSSVSRWQGTPHHRK